jgi:hypothetical protein
MSLQSYAAHLADINLFIPASSLAQDISSEKTELRLKQSATGTICREYALIA